MRVYKLWPHLVFIVFLILLDQLIKGALQFYMTLGEAVAVVRGYFQLFYTTTKTIPAILVWLQFFLILVIFSFLWRALLSPRKRFTIACSLVIGGALSNLMDRYLLGHVVNFLDFFYFPPFNIADIYIVSGGTLLVIPRFYVLYQYIRSEYYSY